MPVPRDPAEPLSDEELATRAQRGCAASFEQLLRRFQTPVLHFLRHRGAAADAEDLLQETFLRAYRNLHRYRPRWRFATWLFTIARRLSINHHRRSRPETGCQELAHAESTVAGPLDSVIEDEDRRGLWTVAAEVLSEREMTALWLHYVENMPVREIAAVLDRSRVAVKTMMFRARKKLLPRLPAPAARSFLGAVEAHDV
jgi:RNA polymerase sigma-70 factor, ECF subfamily